MCLCLFVSFFWLFVCFFIFSLSVACPLFLSFVRFFVFVVCVVVFPFVHFLFVCLFVCSFVCLFAFLSLCVSFFPSPHPLSGMAFLKTIVADTFGRNGVP